MPPSGTKEERVDAGRARGGFKMRISGRTRPPRLLPQNIRKESTVKANPLKSKVKLGVGFSVLVLVGIISAYAATTVVVAVQYAQPPCRHYEQAGAGK